MTFLSIVTLAVCVGSIITNIVSAHYITSVYGMIKHELEKEGRQ